MTVVKIMKISRRIAFLYILKIDWWDINLFASQFQVTPENKIFRLSSSPSFFTFLSQPSSKEDWEWQKAAALSDDSTAMARVKFTSDHYKVPRFNNKSATEI